MFVTAMSLFAALALPVPLAAQHTRYKLIDLGTFGGPQNYLYVPDNVQSRFTTIPPVMLSCPERTNHLAHGAAHQCEFVKPNGVRCRANARTAAAHCWFHDPSLARERHKARTRGGIARTSRRATLPADAPQRPLGSVADVLCLLEEAANAVRLGALEPKLANSVGYLCSVALNGLAQVPSSKSSVVQFLVVPPSGTAECPSCQSGKNADDSQCIACGGTGTLDLSEIPKSDA